MQKYLVGTSCHRRALGEPGKEDGWLSWSDQGWQGSPGKECSKQAKPDLPPPTVTDVTLGQ